MSENWQKDLRKDIAKAIKKADKSYFWEDYNKQANAVMDCLKKSGYTLVPSKATEDQIEAGVNSIHSGRVRPHELVAWIYEGMVKAFK